MVKVIGITGLIASGKSTLSNYLKEKKYDLFDADYEVKELYKSEEFLDKLKISFPNVFINGILNKELLSKNIFLNINEKNKLEKIIHPIIEKKCDIFIKNNINKKIIFLDIPLLFEVGWDKKCDQIILVIVNKKIQKKRYIERGGKEELFEKIIKNQGKLEEKILKSTYILENNEDIFNFYKKIDELLVKI